MIENRWTYNQEDDHLVWWFDLYPDEERFDGAYSLDYYGGSPDYWTDDHETLHIRFWGADRAGLGEVECPGWWVFT